MDLSIIVPCHNLEKYMYDLLMSLKFQNLKDHEVEVIFVCDACTDNTKKVIEDFELDNYASKIILDANVKSCGLARNVGLEVATGFYIWFLDGDDWLLEFDAVSSVIELMDECAPDILRVGFDCAYADRHKFNWMVWQYIYTRSIIGDTRFLPIQPNEDLEFYKEITAKKPNILAYGRKLYYYNFLREGSNMQQLLQKGRIEP